jgi:hypothetical protein
MKTAYWTIIIVTLFFGYRLYLNKEMLYRQLSFLESVWNVKNKRFTKKLEQLEKKQRKKK